MTRIFDTTAAYKECSATDVEVVGRARLSALRTTVGELGARIEQAQELGQPPSTMTGVMVRRIRLDLNNALDAAATLYADCDWAGEVEVRYVTGDPTDYEVAWECPRCLTTHTEQVRGGDDD